MIDLVDIDADHVLGVRIYQNLLASDISLAMNFLENKNRTRDKIALYAEIEAVSDIESGVLQKELTHGAAQLQSLRHIEKVAVVTDHEAIRGIGGMLNLIPMAEVKTFSWAEKEEARAWVKEPLPASSSG